jgi:hypothetical protein
MGCMGDGQKKTGAIIADSALYNPKKPNENFFIQTLLPTRKLNLSMSKHLMLRSLMLQMYDGFSFCQVSEQFFFARRQIFFLWCFFGGKLLFEQSERPKKSDEDIRQKWG